MPKCSILFACLLWLQLFFGLPIHAQKLYPMGHTVEVEIMMRQHFITEKSEE